MTASEWNKFRDYAFDKCGYCDDWVEVNQNELFTAEHFNIAANHIGYSNTVNPGESITATLLNGLVTTLNSI